jgi:hypothetical protein
MLPDRLPGQGHQYRQQAMNTAPLDRLRDSVDEWQLSQPVVDLPFSAARPCEWAHDGVVPGREWLVGVGVEVGPLAVIPAT